MCYDDNYTVDHLLLHLDVARELWSLIFPLIGVEWVFSGKVMEVLHFWRGGKVGCRRRKAWGWAPKQQEIFEGKKGLFYLFISSAYWLILLESDFVL